MRFKKCHGITQASVSGESKSAEIYIANTFLEKSKNIVEECKYAKEQIYHWDETAL